jgi:Leucine-rich repeat (LRR) protein
MGVIRSLRALPSRELNLSGDQNVDLNKIVSQHPHLRKLDISYCEGIEDFSPLEKLSKLVSLSVRGNEVFLNQFQHIGPRLSKNLVELDMSEIWGDDPDMDS